ncbi:MAG TPA: hypothetical protein VGH89_15545 [Pseudonocardia sp.]
MFLIGFWVLAGFVPPPSPSRTAVQVVEFYRADPVRIRLGLTVAAFGGTLIGPFFAGLSVQLKRIEGRHSPATYAQLGLGSLMVLEFVFPLFVFLAAAYRPATHSPDLILFANDLGWLSFIGIVSSIVVQCIIIGLTILRDGSERPVFPRWVGYYNLWVAIAYCPSALVVFFKHGPLAWNGIFAWWLLAVAFFSWIMVLTWNLFRAIRQLEVSTVGPARGRHPQSAT